jgi:hypothetical protein
MPTHLNDHNRLLAIKLNVLKRITADIASYHREASSTMSMIKALDTQPPGEDTECKRRQYLQSFDETSRMIPECRQRLAAARDDLERFLSTFGQDLGVDKVNEANDIMLNSAASV